LKKNKMNHHLIMENWRKFITECECSNSSSLEEISFKTLKQNIKPWVSGLEPSRFLKDIKKEIKSGYWRDVLISLLIGAGIMGTTVLTKDLVVPKDFKDQQSLVKQLEISDDPEAKKALDIYNKLRKK
tara:strand:+ start:1240 stop:1623 length:384 start_codon:yes stop_codon:yes gene_type:complete